MRFNHGAERSEALIYALGSGYSVAIPCGTSKPALPAARGKG